MKWALKDEKAFDGWGGSGKILPARSSTMSRHRRMITSPAQRSGKRSSLPVSPHSFFLFSLPVLACQTGFSPRPDYLSLGR